MRKRDPWKITLIGILAVLVILWVVLTIIISVTT